jgi:hypothetical protein
MKTKVILITAVLFLIAIRGAGQASRTDTIRDKKEGVVVITTTVDLPGDAATPKNKSADAVKPKQSLALPQVKSVVSLRPRRQASQVVFGDYITLTIDDRSRFDALRDSLRKSAPPDSTVPVILYINGNAARDLQCISENRETAEFVFYLKRDALSMQRFYPAFNTMFSRITLKFSIGFPDGTFLGYTRDYSGTAVRYVSVGALVSALALVVIILGIVFFLSRRTDLIRAGDKSSQFSLGLTQLAFWTVIIASSYFYLWIVNSDPGAMTGSTLILLGISIVTTAGSKLVDFRRKEAVTQNLPSQGFWKDIASDNVGYSVHRCQMILWTLILGIIFVQKVITRQEMPEFDDTLLALMGISSAGFIGLKTMEGKAP